KTEVRTYIRVYGQSHWVLFGGVIIGSVLGAVGGAMAGNCIGAIRDNMGWCVYERFWDLDPGNKREPRCTFAHSTYIFRLWECTTRTDSTLITVSNHPTFNPPFSTRERSAIIRHC